MSGSNSGSYTPPPGITFNCETGVITTNLASIDLDVLAKQKVGSVLDVELNANSVLIVVDGNGETLGSVLHSNVPEIIECIKQGNTYQATILSINEPSCRVQIKRKNK